MARRSLALALSLAFAAPAAAGEPKGKREAEPGFAERLKKLLAETKPLQIKMKPTDKPEVLPDLGAGTVLVSGKRGGIYVPPVLSPGDIMDVVNEHMVDVRKCYKEQLADDPEWSDDLIVDIGVKKTGRVSELTIAPKRVARDKLGQCLLSAIPKWSFPEFTGEFESGVTQEVVSVSFPLSFSTR